MKIVQTFWTGSSKNIGNPLDIKCGWRFGEYHWMSWCLSCLQLRSFYNNVELVTDKLGKEILIDIFKLPYTNVSTALEGKMDQYPAELWSMAKIFSYHDQDEPFLHLDGDVFLWKPINNALLNAEVVAQNLEINLPYYTTALKEVSENFEFIPDVLKKEATGKQGICATNTGVFGGNDLSFIKEYCQQAIDFVSRNLSALDKINKGNFNAVFEQCFLYYFSQDKKQPISYFREEPVTDPAYLNYANFMDVPQAEIVHPVGGYKTMLYVCEQLARQLRKQYPEWYYAIVNTCRKCRATTERKIYSLSLFREVDFYPSIFDLKRNYYRNKDGNLNGKKLNGAPVKPLRIESKQAFSRSAAVLDQFNKNAGAAGLSNEQRRCMNEIFNLEYRKFMLSRSLQRSEMLVALYFDEIVRDERTETVFNNVRADILDTKITINSANELHQLKWNWDPASVGNVMLKLAESKKLRSSNGHSVILHADPIGISIRETYLDAMDAKIISLCSRPVRIASVIKQMERCFDAEEIKDKHIQFENLILDTIKRICYAGHLRIA